VNIHGFNFEDPPVKLIRIIPTVKGAEIAFCTPELLRYNQEWTPLGHKRWLREREEQREKV
jgi:hypothetical protein